MPKPKLPGREGQGFNAPPESMRETIGDEGMEYLEMNHVIMYGGTPSEKGTLDDNNVSGISHSNTTSVKFDHHGAGSHDGLDQAVALANLTDGTATSAESVDSVDASDLATAIILVNEIKADLNIVIGEYNTLQSDYAALIIDHNTLKGNMRTAALLAM